MSIQVAPEDKDYQCTLDDASLSKAQIELNEDPKNRLGAVHTLRQWVLEQKHIKCPTDTLFLLAFLRARYFSQLESRTLLENFLSRRERMARWFHNLDPGDKKIQAVVDDGCIVVLPKRDSQGRKIFMLRPGQADYHGKRYSKDDMFRAFAAVLDYIYLTDEVTQVNGTVTILDLTGYTFKHQTHVTLDERRNFLQTWQGNYPARIKEFHLYNEGPFMDFIIGMLKLAMPDKIQKRMKQHGTVLESLFKHIPMNLLPEDYLPDDYEGSSAGTFKSITAALKAELMSANVRDRIKYLSNEKFKVDPKKKLSDVPQASFRKLNID